MKYVHIDAQTGEVNWDDYFEYLRSVREQFPSDLYSYALSWEHYSLDGENSLHDAWLVGAQFGYKAQDVSLEFIGARHDRRLTFQYLAVESYVFDLSVEYRFGDRDVFAHEFRMDDELVTHEIVFSNRKSVLVRSQSIVPTVDVLS
jgi:hypothetical protein